MAKRLRPRAFMPTYWGDYLADVGHLPDWFHGRYLMLIAYYWTTGHPPPDIDDELWRIARAPSLEVWLEGRPSLERLFKVKDGHWFHKRVDVELRRAVHISQKSAANVKKRKWRPVKENNGLQSTDCDPAIERQSSSHPQPHSVEGEPSTASGDDPAAAQAAPVRQEAGKTPATPQGTLGLSEPPETKPAQNGTPTSTAPPPLTTVTPNDQKALTFQSGVSLLMVTVPGMTDKKARTLLGRWRQLSGDATMIDVLAACTGNAPSDPIAWIEGALKHRSKSNGHHPGPSVEERTRAGREAILRATGLASTLEEPGPGQAGRDRGGEGGPPGA